MRKKLLFPAFGGEFKDGKAIRLFTKSKQKSSNKGKKSAASRVTSLHLRGIKSSATAARPLWGFLLIKSSKIMQKEENGDIDLAKAWAAE